MGSVEYVGMDVSQRSDLNRGSKFFWQAGDGVQERNQGDHHARFLKGLDASLHLRFEEGTWDCLSVESASPRGEERTIPEDLRASVGQRRSYGRTLHA
jgi:hypothetical protein